MDTQLGEIGPILASESGLTDIVVNLVFNAIDALPEGGQIDITTEASGNAVVLTVSDNGVGMDQTTQAKVFEPFFTTKADVGTGLGLSTVFGSVVKWGGTVDLKSTLGQGSTFTIRFPIAETQDWVAEVATQRDISARTRVISIEDEAIVREVIAHMVSVNHEITTYGSASVAVEAFTPGAYDVALIDLGMPGIPGDQLATELNTIDPYLVTVLVSGWSLEPDDERLEAFDLQILKPIESVDLLNRVLEEALQIRQKRRSSSRDRSP